MLTSEVLFKREWFELIYIYIIVVDIFVYLHSAILHAVKNICDAEFV